MSGNRVFSKRSFEGYLEIDNRNSPGISPELAAKNHSGVKAVLPQEANKILQQITKKCSHCPAIVVLNPKRTRARGYCPKCDGFVCDTCETNRVLTGVCRPWKQQVDEYIDAAAKGKAVNVTPRGIILPNK